ncbi:MAG: CsbD family protein [Syntrophomonadaceae bacterium]
MNRDEREGKAENLKGRIKEAGGIVTGNEELEKEGADERSEGAIQEGLGRARRKVGEALEDLGKDVKE